MDEKRQVLSEKDLPFVTIAPKILYFGTPVARVSSVNEDGSTNLAPMSSFWALGWTVTLGLLSLTQTLKSLVKRWDCVINLPTSEMWKQVERLAPLTGQNPVPRGKRSQFRYDPDKFAAGEFTPIASDIVAAARVKECPVHLEAVLRAGCICLMAMSVLPSLAAERRSRWKLCGYTCARTSSSRKTTSQPRNGNP